MALQTVGLYNGSSSGGSEYGTPVSWSVDLGSGSDRALLVEAAVPNRNLAALSLTVGGVTCNQSPVYTRAVNGKYVFFWLSGASLPEGTQTFVLATEAGDNLGRPRALVAVYNSVTAVAGPTVVNSSGSAPSVTAASAAGRTVATLGMWDVGSSATVTSPSVERFELADSVLVSYMMDRASTGASTTTAATLSSGSYFVLGAFDLTPTGDTTPPTLTSPSGTGGTLACSGSVSTNESGGTLYAVVTASATAPSAAQVKAGQDHAGASALRVVSQAVSATGTQTISSGSVTAGTRYWHYMHEDEAANQSTVASSASFSVSSGADTTPPVLSSPTGSATGTTTASVGATTDEGNGTLYVVVTTSATQPSVAQIKAGQTHTGSAAPYGSSQAVSSTGAKTFSATGLTAATTYYAHLVHADAAANDSNRVTSASFTTSAGTVYGFDFDTATGLTFGDLAGALTSLARQTSVAIVARAYNASTGALVATSGTLTTDSNGRLPRWTDAALSNATAYTVTFTRSSDSEVCAARLTTT